MTKKTKDSEPTLRRITHSKVRDAALDLRDQAKAFGRDIIVAPIRRTDGYMLRIKQGRRVWEELSGLTTREAFLKIDGITDGLRMIGAAR